MAVHTKHPVSPPPVAPAREKTAHLLLRGWCVFVLFSMLAGTSWIEAFGTITATVMVAASSVISLVVWFLVRPPVQWRRLPWFAVGYVTLACASILWSAWPTTSAITAGLLVLTTLQGVFVAAALTWHELVRSLASALKWIIGLSLAFELWVSVFWGGPILPQFQRPTSPVDPIVYWSRNNLFDGGRIQGIFGSANLLAVVMLVAIIVFAIRYAARAPRREWLIVWIIAAAYVMYRASSATTYLAAAAAVVVLITVLLMRTTKRPGERTRYYVAYATVGALGIAALVFARDQIFGLLGRGSDLTGRERIWGEVLERTSERPIFGWGFATPWLPWDPAFDGWIIDHEQTVMQAHGVWIDVSMQLGLAGVIMLALTYLAFVWRAWFFAVDRPQWDLVSDRPYSPVTLLPTLMGGVLLVQGIAESGPLLLWGWMFLVMFAFKIKQSPLVGVGPIEQRLAMERGELVQSAQ